MTRRTVWNLARRGVLQPITKAEGALGPYLYDPDQVEQVRKHRAEAAS